MSHSLVPFSLLDAARVVARGGGLESKLEALSTQALAVADGDAVTVLLHDVDTDTLLSLDGERTVALAGADADLARAMADRLAILPAGVPVGFGPLLPGARSCLLLPLVVEDEDGAFLEGLMAVGWFATEPPFEEAPDTVLAISDLAAVAIRQARLRNSAWERSDHADRLLHTDRLTGLANRVTFERMLELEIARATRQGTPLAVVLLDVDGLTDISERKGARVADEVLRHVAAAIADRVRLLDTVARFGEDEFVVIAPGDAGGIVALRLRDAIAELPPIGEVEIERLGGGGPPSRERRHRRGPRGRLGAGAPRSQVAGPGLDRRRPGGLGLDPPAGSVRPGHRLERGLHAPAHFLGHDIQRPASVDHDPAAGFGGGHLVIARTHPLVEVPVVACTVLETGHLLGATGIPASQPDLDRHVEDDHDVRLEPACDAGPGGQRRSSRSRPLPYP